MGVGIISQFCQCNCVVVRIGVLVLGHMVLMDVDCDVGGVVDQARKCVQIKLINLFNCCNMYFETDLRDIGIYLNYKIF